MTSSQEESPGTRRFHFASAAYPDGTFSVVRFKGFEDISRPYRFEIVVCSENEKIDGVLNKPAHFVTGGLSNGRQVKYHGIVTEFTQYNTVQGLTIYRVVLKPRIARLDITRLSEVYLHDQTIPEILSDVLTAAGLTSNDFQMFLTRKDYRPRSFVCQYEETYFNFISRLMEHEGVYYYFRQDENQETLVISDSRFSHPAPAVSFHFMSKAGDDASALSENMIRTLTMNQKMVPATVVLKEYNFRKATLNLTVSADVSDMGEGEVTIYGENYRTKEEGQTYAKIRAEEMLCREKLFEGESSAIGLVAGTLVSIEGHNHKSFNQDYLVVGVSHSGSQAWAFLSGLAMDGKETREDYYENTFTLIPSVRQFRPERLTPKPRMSGSMNAIVDAEGSGTYADINNYGQYKVRFPFGKSGKADGKGSAWIRMASPYAGSDHGMHFPLLKDTEVLLTFVDGDPDEPVIAGAVPNSTNPSVVTRDNVNVNRIRSAGGNELWMGDERSGQHIILWSPGHRSGLGMGSTGGIASLTPKNQNTFVGGFSNDQVLGARASVTAGQSGAVNVGAATTVNAAVSATFNIPPSLTFGWGDSYCLGPGGSSSNLQKDGSLWALDQIQLAAGLSEGDIPRKRINAAYAAIGLAAAATIAGATVTFVKHRHDKDDAAKKEEKPEWKPDMDNIDAQDPHLHQDPFAKKPDDAATKEDDSEAVKNDPKELWALGAMSAISFATSIAAIPVARSAAKAFDAAVEAGHAAGVVTVNKHGVSVGSYAQPILLQSHNNVTTVHSRTEFGKGGTKIGHYNGLTINPADNAVMAEPVEKSELEVKYAGVKLQCRNSTKYSELELKENTAVTSVNPDGGKVSIDGSQVMLAGKDGKASITVGKTSCIVKAGEAEMVTDAAGLTARFKVKKSYVSANVASLNIDGAMVKIG